MAMLCRVKMTSRCIRPKTAVETEIISAGSFLKRRTRRCFFTTVCQQLQNLWFSTKNTAPVRLPWGNEHSVLYMLLFKQIIEKIPVEVVPISWSLVHFPSALLFYTMKLISVISDQPHSDKNNGV